MSVKKLLEALRNIIVGHKSLLKNKKILYWDVFKNNIFITESVICGALKERLINLDLIKELNSVLTRASY
jgi:hypothetical protein